LKRCFAGRPGRRPLRNSLSDRPHGAGGARDGASEISLAGRNRWLPRHGAKAKALAGIEGGGLQPAIIKENDSDWLYSKYNFPVVRAFQAWIHCLLNPAAVHAVREKKDRVAMSVSEELLRGKKPARTRFAP